MRPFSHQLSSSSIKSQQLSQKLISIDTTKELHGHLIKNLKHKDPISISVVLHSYSLSSATLNKAYFVFDEIKRPTLLLWNYMIKGLSKSNDPIKAIKMYNHMRSYGLNGNNLSLIHVLKSCGRVLDIVQGKKIHGQAIKFGFGSYLFVLNCLIHMYGSCKEMGFAQKVFDEMIERDLVSWNTLICGYSQCNKYREVLGVFDAMQVVNVRADAVTMVKVVIACSNLCEWNVADLMVDYIEKNCVKIDVYLGNTLIDMYGKRGLMKLARRVFDQMSEKNVVSWNSLMTGYAKLGDLSSARKLFDEMPERNVISWTSMITGYSQAGKFFDAVECFRNMMSSNIKPDEITISSILSACAHLGMFEMGKEIHEFVIEHNIRVDIYIGNSLIDLYCKCGDVKKALHVFHDMKEKDSVSWTAIIGGLAVNGFANDAIDLFEEMLSENVKPTDGAFVGLLLACSHGGLVVEGMRYFDDMQKVYGIVPHLKHYGCVVDLLSRSGELERAYEFIAKMKIPPDAVMWRTLLSACKLHGNFALAEVVLSKLREANVCSIANFILLSGSYKEAERWDAAIEYRDLMQEKVVQKASAWSCIEIAR